MPTIRKSTHQLRNGDTLRHHGMRLLLDQDIVVSRSHAVDDNSPTLRTRALCLNPDELEPGIKCHLDDTPTGPRWSIQGNGLANWFVEVTD